MEREAGTNGERGEDEAKGQMRTKERGKMNKGSEKREREVEKERD